MNAEKLSDYKQISGYGIVYLFSHGGFALDGAYSLCTAAPVSAADCLLYMLGDNKDSDLIRIELEYAGSADPLHPPAGHYHIMSNFFRNFCRFPNSMVFVLACNSAANGVMWRAFMDNGAGAYLGFSKVVQGDYANAVTEAMTKKMISSPTSAFSALNEAKQIHGDYNSFCFAYPILFGNPLLSLFAIITPDLKNGSFEEYDAYWTYSGQSMSINDKARIYRTSGWGGTLVSKEPSHGGLVADFGPDNCTVLRQNFYFEAPLLPPDDPGRMYTTTLKFDYSWLWASEADAFTVDISPIIREDCDPAPLFPSDAHFTVSVSGLNCPTIVKDFPFQGITSVFGGGGEGGWNTATIDITQFQGSEVKLELRFYNLSETTVQRRLEFFSPTASIGGFQMFRFATRVALDNFRIWHQW